MRVSDTGSGLSGRWDLDRTQLGALMRVQRRSGLGHAVSAPAGGQARAASYYLKFMRFTVFGLPGAAGIWFPSFFLGLAFSYSLIMLMFGLMFVSYLTEVLLDTSDNRVLLHLPISGRTLLLARMLYVAEYAGLLALSISLPAAVALTVRFGPEALLVFVISVVLMLIFLTAGTLAMYLLALRHVNPARIRQGILYLQTVFVGLSYYAASTVLNASGQLAQIASDVSGQAWWYFYPPGWLAGFLDYSLMEKTRFNGVLAATAVLAPLAGFIGCILLFEGGRFTALLSRLEAVPRASDSTPKSLRTRLARLSERISVLLNADRQERAVFRLTSRLMKSDQALKLRIYPMIGSMLINLVVLITQLRGRPAVNLAIFVCCYPPLFLAVMAPFIQYSPEWRAGWCYQVLPFAKPGTILSGAMKAYIWSYILPIYLVFMAVSAAVWGAAAALDALLAGVVTTLVCVYVFWSGAPEPPYSRKLSSSGTRKGGTLRRLAFIPMAFGLIALHIVLKLVAGSWGVVGGVIAIAGAIVVVHRKLLQMAPRQVEEPDRHVGWHRSGS